MSKTTNTAISSVWSVTSNLDSDEYIHDSLCFFILELRQQNNNKVCNQHNTEREIWSGVWKRYSERHMGHNRQQFPYRCSHSSSTFHGISCRGKTSRACWLWRPPQWYPEVSANFTSFKFHSFTKDFFSTCLLYTEMLKCFLKLQVKLVFKPQVSNSPFWCIQMWVVCYWRQAVCYVQKIAELIF